MGKVTNKWFNKEKKCHDKPNCEICKRRDREDDLLLQEKEDKMRDRYRMGMQEDEFGETPFDDGVIQGHPAAASSDVLYVNVRSGESIEDAFRRYGLEPPAEGVIEGQTYDYPDPKEKDEPGGLHYDKGKLRVDLVPPEAIEAIAEIMTYGCKKYAERNWEEGIRFSRVYGSLFRHLLKWFRREDTDEESGLAHLKHALWNLAAIVTYVERGREDLDDRPNGHKKEKTWNHTRPCDCCKKLEPTKKPGGGTSGSGS